MRKSPPKGKGTANYAAKIRLVYFPNTNPERNRSLTHSLIELGTSCVAANCAAPQDFPVFYGIWRFITVFTRALHRPLSWARSIQSIPSHLISQRTILILSTHLRLGLRSGLFPSGFPTSNHHSKVFKFTSRNFTLCLKKRSNYVQHLLKVKCVIRMDCNSENIPNRDHFKLISAP
jgi:hypothetical protein